MSLRFPPVRPRDDHLAAFCQAIQGQHHRGRTVVHSHRANPAHTFLIEQLCKQPLKVDIPLAALSSSNIKFQIRIATGNLMDALQRRCSQRRPAQVGVQNDSGSVDYRLQRKFQRAVQFTGNGFCKPGKRKLHRIFRGEMA